MSVSLQVISKSFIESKRLFGGASGSLKMLSVDLKEFQGRFRFLSLEKVSRVFSVHDFLCQFRCASGGLRVVSESF